MKKLIAVAVVFSIVSFIFTSEAFAQRGTKIRFGFLGTTVKAPCGASVCASPCGVKVAYGGGYGGGGCNSGYCGPHVEHHGGGYGCGTACGTNACATCPQQGGCHSGPEPYGIRTQSCVNSYLPPESAVQSGQLQLQSYGVNAPYPQQYQQPGRVVYIMH